MRKGVDRHFKLKMTFTEAPIDGINKVRLYDKCHLKYVICLCSCMILMIGAALFGAWYVIRFETNTLMTGVPQTLFVVGFFTIVASLFGIYGSITFSRHALEKFNHIIFCLILFNCWATFYVYIKLDYYRMGFVDFVTSAFGTPLFGYLQLFLHCCGAYNISDYHNTLPLSCCPPGDDLCCTASKMFRQPCNEAAEHFFDAALGPAFIFFIFKSSFEGVALFFSFHIVKYYYYTPNRSKPQIFSFFLNDIPKIGARRLGITRAVQTK